MFDLFTSRFSEQALATVLSAEIRGNRIRDHKFHYEFLIEVRPDNRAPFRTTIRGYFNAVALRPRVGDVLRVRYNPKTLKARFVLKGDVRYDHNVLEYTGDIRNDYKLLAADPLRYQKLAQKHRPAQLKQPGSHPYAPKPDHRQNSRSTDEFRKILQ
ncbi:hypothetical protein EI42_05945 [Thermosporothrix hazakensis]|jgi:hypothetical protein|uniref:Uncharacterized protein n=1 Tax=Thermosporothrix hazakensis TaxID=644383 RepID=A0A326TSD4_THEHA|nr:hypothetical protein [Thermosporothrix hazakensis]PZW19717.1 hypothetical protein EI42_05945 [Thermosporothrix hazakensis]GCE48586.1 hypothetical protein KTH_34550 [Thermosporothrix hazakensis]